MTVDIYRDFPIYLCRFAKKREFIKKIKSGTRYCLMAFLLFLLPGFTYVNAQCPSTPNVTVSSLTASSCPSNGSVTLGGNGVGNANVVYEITTAPNSSYIGLQQSGTANTFVNLEPGAYVIEMSCIGSSATASVNFTIANNYVPRSATVTANSSCLAGTATNTISLSNISGSATPLQYAFYKTSNPNIDDTLLTYGSATSYNTPLFGDFMVRIKDACGGKVTYPINIAPVPTYVVGGIQAATKITCDTVKSEVLLQSSQGNYITTSPAGGVTVKVYYNAGGCTKGALFSSTYFPAGTLLGNGGATYKVPPCTNVAIEVVNACGDLGNLVCQNGGSTCFDSQWKPENASCNTVQADTINLRHIGTYRNLGSVTYTLYKNGSSVGSTTNTSSPLFFGLSTAGNTYIIVAKDSCGTTDTSNFVVPSGSISITSPGNGFVSCSDINKVSVDFYVTGNIPKATQVVPVIVSGPCCIGQTGTQSLSNGYFTMNSLVPGTYRVAFTYPSGICNTYPDTFTVVVNPVPVNFSVNGVVNQVCGGQASVTANLQFSPSSFTSVINLKTLSGTLVQTNTTGVFNGIPAGTYTLEFYPYSLGCNTNYGGIVTRDTIIVLPANAAPQVAKKFGFICEGTGGNQLSTGQALFEMAGFGPYDVYYSTTSTQPGSPQLSAQSSPIAVGALAANQTYYFWFKDQCGNTTAVTQLGIAQMGQLSISETVHPCEGDPYTLSMFEYPGASYIWKKGTATLSNTRDYFIANYDSSYNGTYTGTMTINGCITRSVTVTINSSLCSTPLPLSLLDFTAVVAGNNVNLAWTTTDERNVSNFEIERSPDATNWTRISRVNAKGMSKNLNTYFYQDSKPFTGVNFYRLKVIDIDKTFKMSPVRVVRLDQDFELQLFPNPTQTSAKLILQKPASQGSELILYDDFGRLLSRQSVANQQVIIVNTENYHPGIYFIMISNNGNIIYKGKLIKI